MDQMITPLIDALGAARKAVNARVVGQEAVVDQVLIALICGGHVLLEGTPGVGKTLLVRTIGEVTGLDFGRVQFTPDLMPADVTGAVSLNPDENGRLRAEFQQGPVFTQILLADEINRATPRTQSSLLEAMQEGTVTVAGKTMELPKPFLVLATQNPVEMDGTYLLPEAQIDRFLFKSMVTYPSEDALDAILDMTPQTIAPVKQQLDTQKVLALQALVRQVPMADSLRRAVARFSRQSQPDSPEAPQMVKDNLRWGLSPRGAQAFVLAARGNALLHGRAHVGAEDLRAVLTPIARHRLMPSYRAVSANTDIDALALKLLNDLL